MGGENFCIVVLGMAVLQLFSVLAPESDARMAQTGYLLYKMQYIDY
jgi:hypothetical protein